MDANTLACIRAESSAMWQPTRLPLGCGESCGAPALLSISESIAYTLDQPRACCCVTPQSSDMCTGWNAFHRQGMRRTSYCVAMLTGFRLPLLALSIMPDPACGMACTRASPGQASVDSTYDNQEWYDFTLNQLAECSARGVLPDGDSVCM